MATSSYALPLLQRKKNTRINVLPSQFLANYKSITQNHETNPTLALSTPRRIKIDQLLAMYVNTDLHASESRHWRVLIKCIATRKSTFPMLIGTCRIIRTKSDGLNIALFKCFYFERRIKDYLRVLQILNQSISFRFAWLIQTLISLVFYYFLSFLISVLN